jgi:hypothetical protein
MPTIEIDTDINAQNGLSNAGENVNTGNIAVVGNGPYSPPTSTRWIRQRLIDDQRLDTLQFPSDLPKYYIRLGLSKYTRINPTRGAVLTPSKFILLPLPLQLMDNQGVSYEEQQLGPTLGTVANMADAVKDRVKNIMSATPPSISDPKSLGDYALKIGSELGGLASDAVKGVVTQGPGLAAAQARQAAGNAGAVSDVVLGYSPNQFLTILLKGPMYKRNEFTWKLSPRSPIEAKAINQIVRLMNNSMAPGITGGGYFFSFPSIFSISFMPNSQYLFKMKPSVLENMVINYTPAGRNGFLRADENTSGLNAPESVEIKVRFLELEYWLAGDFIEDNNPANVTEGIRQDIKSPEK